MAILNEVYVGRLPEIEQMLSDIHAIREEYKKKGNISILKTTKIFEKHVEEMWGFKAFLFDIYISSIPNAETHCAGSCMDTELSDVIQYTSKGYRFAPESNIAVISKIASCILSDDYFSDEEILGLLLHEIGHSFVERSTKINENMKAYRSSLLSLYLLQILLDICYLNPFALKRDIGSIKYIFSNLTTISIKLKKITKNIPGLRHISMSMSELGTFIKENFKKWTTKISRSEYDDNTLSNMQKYKKEIEKKSQDEKLSVARATERLSDDFANMYGFGPYTITALLKMGNPYRTGPIDKDSVTELQKKIDACALSIITLIDDHPNDYDRLLSMIEGLEYDYKNLKVDKKIKDQMKKDIDALQKIKDDIKKTKGLIKEYDNKYIEKYAADSINKGNSETKKEKQYNDRHQINKDWEKKKINI